MTDEDKQTLHRIREGALKGRFVTTPNFDGVRHLFEADLIEIYDVYPDGRIRWMLTPAGRAAIS